MVFGVLAPTPCAPLLPIFKPGLDLSPPARRHQHTAAQLGNRNRFALDNPMITNAPVSLTFAFSQSRLGPPRQGLPARFETTFATMLAHRPRRRGAQQRLPVPNCAGAQIVGVEIERVEGKISSNGDRFIRIESLVHDKIK